MPQTIVVPKVGVVAFPPEMQPSEINEAVRTLHQKAVLKSVLKFVAKDPALVGLAVPEFYKQLSGIAAFLEKYSSLARAADAGIHGEKVHDLPTLEEENQGPIEPEEAAQPEAQPQPAEETPESEQASPEPSADVEPAK